MNFLQKKSQILKGAELKCARTEWNNLKHNNNSLIAGEKSSQKMKKKSW